MGRPREHDEHTRAALRAAAERLVADGGVAAFSVRAVADQAGTTTRAVYSLFGSKDGLLVDALAQGAFDYLTEGIDALGDTDDPVADLIAVVQQQQRRIEDQQRFIEEQQRRLEALEQAGSRQK